MSSFEDALKAWDDGMIVPVELERLALDGLRLANVHRRAGYAPVHARFELADRWPIFAEDDPLEPALVVAGVGVPVGLRVRDRRARWAAASTTLVLWTWKAAPPGGWLARRPTWERLLDLERALADGTTVDGLDDDLADPEPVVRWWALVHADVADRLDVLDRHLDDRDPTARLLACGGLRERGFDTPRLRERLRTLLTVGGRCVPQAIGLLSDLADREALATLLRLARDRDDATARAAVGALRFPEALPVLERHLLDGYGWEALRAVQALGADAATLTKPVLQRLEPLARREGGGSHGAHVWFESLGAIGEGARDVEPLLVELVQRPGRGPEYDRWRRAAAGALARISDDGRAFLASFLQDADVHRRRRAVLGLAAAGSAASAWRGPVASLLDEPLPTILAVDVAVALASMGDVGTARDVWLDLAPWPLNHHASYPGLFRLARLLRHGLPALLASADAAERARTATALATLGRGDPPAGRTLWGLWALD